MKINFQRKYLNFAGYPVSSLAEAEFPWASKIRNKIGFFVQQIIILLNSAYFELTLYTMRLVQNHLRMMYVLPATAEKGFRIRFHAHLIILTKPKAKKGGGAFSSQSNQKTYKIMLVPCVGVSDFFLSFLVYIKEHSYLCGFFNHDAHKRSQSKEAKLRSIIIVYSSSLFE